jgi:hypothetical protein
MEYLYDGKSALSGTVFPVGDFFTAVVSFLLVAAAISHQILQPGVRSLRLRKTSVN